MRKTLLLIALLIFGIWNINAQNKKEVYYQAFKELIESKDFDFEGVTAFPQSGGSININGEINYVRIRQDSVKIYMPYFGESQTLNSFNSSNNAITFEGLMENYEVDINEKNGRIRIKFFVKGRKEGIDMSIIFYKNLSARLVANSSARDGISYDGNILTAIENRTE